MKKLSLISIALYLIVLANSYAATKNDPHLPISHCYHWINEQSKGYLSFKYQYAKSNGNELTFFTTPGTSNGSVAGPGLYCAKSPSGSYGYGDRLIRIELVDDIVLLDEPSGTKYCGTSGETSRTSSTCAQKTWDIKFYDGGGIGNRAWYVIQNPMAIAAWSASSDQLISDLQTSMGINDSSFQSHAQNTITAINQERSIMGEQVFYNVNARSSIVDMILKDPEKLNSIPPINIVARVSVDNTGKLTDLEKKDVYQKYIYNALKSDEIAYSDYRAIVDKNDDVKKEFLKIVDRFIIRSNKLNSLVIFRATIDFPNGINNEHKYQAQLINEIFANPYHLKEFAQADIKLNNQMSSQVRSLILGLENKNANSKYLAAIPALLKNYLSSREAKSAKDRWLKKLVNGSNANFGIKIGRTLYNLDENNSNYKDQCETIVDFSNASGATKIKYYKSEIDVGSINATNKTSICTHAQQLLTSIKNIKGAKTKKISYIVKGRFETQNYIFVGAARDDIVSQCKSFHGTLSNPASVDEIYYAVNNANEQRLYNSSSYWKTESEACGQLINAIKGSVPTYAELESKRKMKALIDKWRTASNNSNAPYKVTGKFEQVDYFFYGFDREEIISQCHEFYQYLPGKNSIDEIFWGVNGGSQSRLYNSSSYWKTKNDVCGQVQSAIAASVPTKEQVRFKQYRTRLLTKWKAEAKKTSAKYIVKGRFENNQYYFYGETREDIRSQCDEYYQYLEGKSNIDEIFYSVNGSSEQKSYNSSSYWKTKAQTCGQLESAIASQVKSRAEIKAEQERIKRKKKRDDYTKNMKLAFDNSNATYKVKGRFETANYYFYGENQEEIVSQCHEFHPYIEDPNSVDEIFISVNGQSEQKQYNSSSYWKTKTAACNAFQSGLNGKVLTKAQIKTKQEEQRKRAELARHIQVLKTSYQSSIADYKVKGKFENTEFYFSGNQREELVEACEDFADKIIFNPRIDDIELSINDGRLIKKRNSSSYWDNKAQLCNAFEQAISSVPNAQELRRRAIEQQRRQDFAKLQLAKEQEFENSNASFKVKGQVKSFNFYFFGENREEILNQCDVFTQVVPDNSRINGFSLVVGNTASKNISYSGRVNDICSKVGSEIAISVPTKAMLKRMADLLEYKNEFDQSRASIKIIVQSGENQIYLHGESQDEAKNQCVDLYPYLENLKSSISYQVNGNNKTEKLNSYRRNANSFCTSLMSALYFEFPTRQILEMKEDQENSNAQYKVSGLFGKSQFYIFGDSKEDLVSECYKHYNQMVNNNLKKAVYNLSWTINASSVEYKITKRSSLKSRRKLCKAFGNELAKALK